MTIVTMLLWSLGKHPQQRLEDIGSALFYSMLFFPFYCDFFSILFHSYPILFKLILFFSRF